MNTENPDITPSTPLRRRLFSRYTVLAFVAGAALAVGVGASARSVGMAGWHHGSMLDGTHSAADVNGHVEHMLKHFYVEIDATEAQKQKLDPIVKQAAKDLLPLRAKMHEARKQGTALLSAETVDRAAIESFRVQQLQLADTASKRFSQALTDVAEVLTPAQRKDLAQRLEKMGPGMRGHMHHG